MTTVRELLLIQYSIIHIVNAKVSNLVLVSIEALEHVVCKKVGFEKHFKDKHGCKPCWKMVI